MSIIKGDNMANFYCENCDTQIDLDFNVEHYAHCPDFDYAQTIGAVALTNLIAERVE
jgi:hypothetical protein